MHCAKIKKVLENSVMNLSRLSFQICFVHSIDKMTSTFFLSQLYAYDFCPHFLFCWLYWKMKTFSFSFRVKQICRLNRWTAVISTQTKLQRAKCFFFYDFRELCLVCEPVLRTARTCITVCYFDVFEHMHRHFALT